MVAQPHQRHGGYHRPALAHDEEQVENFVRMLRQLYEVMPTGPPAASEPIPFGVFDRAPGARGSSAQPEYGLAHRTTISQKTPLSEIPTYAICLSDF